MSQEEDKSSLSSEVMQKQINDLQQLVALQMQVMEMHTKSIADPSLRSTPTIGSQQVKNIKAPEGRYDMSTAEFRMYSKDCHDFMKLTQFTNEQIVIQMRLNMDADLKRAVDTNCGDSWNGKSVEEALISIKEIIKKTSNSAVHRKMFDGMSQKSSESVREFITRLKACAIDCEYTCPFDENHDLTDYHIVNRIRCGITDKQLQQELLQKADTVKSLTEMLAYCENFESAKQDRDKLRNETQAVSGISSIETSGLTSEDIVAAISNYRRSKKDSSSKCYYCGFERHDKSKCPAQGKICTKCNKLNHFSNVCKSKSKPTAKDKQTTGSAAVIICTIQSIEASSLKSAGKLPTLSVSSAKSKEDKGIEMEAVADTGAQACVAGREHMRKLNLSIADLSKPSLELRHVGGDKLNVLGSKIVNMELNGENIDVEVYFIKGITSMYLSIEACKKMHIIPQNFPFTNIKQSNCETPLPSAQNDDEEVEVSGAQCEKAGKFPSRPKALPFPPTKENVSKLKEWLLQTFADTTFNTKADQLPVMAGKPHKIHLKPDAIPYAAHTPIPIPLHWKDEVKAQLDRDEDMGIIQKVPVGEANEWCMRMITVPKADGSPRRTIDFQAINKSCLRETHYTPTPFSVVSSIPNKMYKSVLDAFNGYHQVKLDEDSVKLTNFITEFGRYQYLRAPQGHIASGDGYVRRFDDIISNVERKKKIVDDVLLYDASIEESFYHALDFLLLCGQNGVTINPEKLQFCEEEVEFVGYNVGWDGYRPSDNMISAIKNFPMPAEPSLTDIRAWFGLVNQIAPFLASSALMEPFRELLKPTRSIGKQVFWDEELQTIFKETQSKLCELISTGLAYYEIKRKTIVISDWSQAGIGFVIMQKHCKCKDIGDSSLCCVKGWKPVLCHSRHLTEKEMRFRPIEGEALAVDWALKKGRLFLQGNDNFDIIVDHKPLLKIFGDKPLHEIENPILQNFKERSLTYTFKMRYIKGIKNHANTLSRYPVSEPDKEDIDRTERCNAVMIAAINKSTEIVAITMEKIKEAAQSDSQYKQLYKTILHSSFLAEKSDELPVLKEFHSVRDRLSIVNGAIMYGFEGNKLRVLVPKSLRKQVIENMHAANQGSTSMLARARQSVYWPGMDRDINSHCESCLQCREMAPSKPKEPLITSDIPEYPFQHVVSDMFEIDQQSYLAYVDRLTAFAELAYFPGSTASTTIINVLREFFHRWGVPEEISIDGATNYTSKEITDWLEKWGVHIRLSSAYYPQSNGRAEAGVKSLKRLLEGNLGPRGSINTDKIAQALMQYRNTPLRDVNESPAQLALGRSIRDTIPLPRERYCISSEWARNLHEREAAMKSRNEITKLKYDQNAHCLSELKVSDHVLCQNVRTKKWDRRGVIVEVKTKRQYLIRMCGSGRIALRNRRHLQKVSPKVLSSQQPSASKNADGEDNQMSGQQPDETVHDEVNDTETQEDTTEEATNALRRSTRARRPPTKYSDEYC